MRRVKILAMLLACIISLTGCWDKVEIEERAFVLAIGIDKAEGNRDDGEEGENRYLITFVNPDTSKAEEGKVLEFITFDIEASTYTTGITRLLQEFAQFHSYQHTKVLIFGQKLLEDQILTKSILDAFLRSHQFNDSILVFMTNGKAADVFAIKPKMKGLLAYYIAGIADNERYATRIGRMTFLDFMRQLTDNKGNAVIPSIEPVGEDTLVSAYLGVIQDYKHTAHLNAKETKAWKWLNGHAEGGVQEVEEGNIPIPFIYFTFKRKVNLDKVEGGKIYLTYSLETEGTVEDYTLGEKLLDEKKLESLEVKLEESIENDCKDFIKKTQEEYKADFLGVRDYLSKYHPRIYESIEKDFEEYFERNIVVDVKADVKIRRIGKSE